MSLDFVGGDVGLFDVGFLDGDNVGSNVADCVGLNVGDCVGLLDGNIDGFNDGFIVGFNDGDIVGLIYFPFSINLFFVKIDIASILLHLQLNRLYAINSINKYIVSFLDRIATHEIYNTNINSESICI